MEQKPKLIDSLMVYQLTVPIEGKDISLKITVKNFEPLRIEPLVNGNDDLMLFMRLTPESKKDINAYLTEHLNTYRNLV